MKVSVASVNRVADAATATTLAQPNADRHGLVVMNDSDQVLYVKLGGSAATTDFTYKLAAGDTLELPKSERSDIYTGIVTGIWAANSTGGAQVTEW